MKDQHDAPMALREAHRELAKWLNEEQTEDIDRVALATVLWAVAQQIDAPQAQPAADLADEELFSALKSVDPEAKRLPPGFRDFACAVLALQKAKQITPCMG